MYHSIAKIYLQIHVDNVVEAVWMRNGHFSFTPGIHSTRHLMEQLPAMTISFNLCALNIIVVLWLELLLKHLQWQVVHWQ